MKIVVTGASGFIGSHLTKKLSSEHDLLGIARSALNVSFETISADINDIDSLPRDYDVFIHAAGQAHIQQNNNTKALFVRNNIRATERALKLAYSANVKHFILISSIASLSDDEQDVYAQTKRESEKITTAFCEANKMSFTIIRPVMVYGENDTKGNMHKLINQLQKGFFPLLNSGKTVKNMIYIQNLIYIISSVMLNPDHFNKIINARDNETLDMKSICLEIEKHVGRKVVFVLLPRFLCLVLIKIIAIAQMIGIARSLNINSIQKLLVDVNIPTEGFNLPYSSFDGIKRTVRG